MPDTEAPDISTHTCSEAPQNLQALAECIQQWGRELGFQQVGITDTNLSAEEPRLKAWLEKGYHGDMAWMGAHGNMRSRPDELLPGSLRVISARLDYLPADTDQIKTLKSPEQAYVSRYALGRDYHKLIRKRLSQLAKKIEQAAMHLDDWPPPQAMSSREPSDNIINNLEPSGSANRISQRAFVDSAPVMERPLAAKAGLGWIGKHTLLLNSDAGSWFFLGEVLTNIPLPVDNPLDDEQPNRCGDCQACLKVCPTDAFPRPYELDARRCISYLTIESKVAIPLEFREPIGNRVFGCDDCQAICPWNKFAQFTAEDDFSPRHALDKAKLVDLFLWDETTFLKNTEGSAIRRIGFEGWQRNLAVGLGNAPSSIEIIAALSQRREQASDMVREHIDWALAQQNSPQRRRKRKIKAAK